MTDINYAADKWERKTQQGASKWKTNVAKADYCGAFQKFVGHSTPNACSSWRSGIDFAVSHDAFATGVSGKKQAYINGLQGVS